MTIFSQGANQSVAGTDKGNAIINCHLLTGRIGKPGASPFSITGQPNAMGGREVGGLANMLAAHMNIEDEAARDRVQRFWGSPSIASRPGLKAVDLFRAVRDGQIKALWIMSTNPVDSLPEADEVRQALAICPFVVVSDIARETDTTPMLMCSSRLWAGVKRMAPSPIPNAGSRANAPSCRPRRSAGGLVADRGSGTPDGLFRLRSREPSGRVFRTCGALGLRESWHAGF